LERDVCRSKTRESSRMITLSMVVKYQKIDELGK